MYALAADCSIGSAGSAILMTHSRSAQGEPALIYLKVRRELLEICGLRSTADLGYFFFSSSTVFGSFPSPFSSIRMTLCIHYDK